MRRRAIRALAVLLALTAVVACSPEPARSDRVGVDGRPTDLPLPLASDTVLPTPATEPTAPPVGKLIFQDDFEGQSLDSRRWQRYSGQPKQRPAGWFNPSLVVVQDGIVSLRGRSDASRGGQFVSAGITSAPGLRAKYGTFLVRFRSSGDVRVDDSLVLWPSSDQAPPFLAFAARRALRNGVLLADSAVKVGRGQRIASHERALSDRGWHVAGVTWSPDRADLLLDGKVWASFTGRAVPQVEMVLDLQSEAPRCATTTGGGCLSGVIAHQLDIDWVKVYAPAA